ncbi:MAG TPA: aldehyde dehydrogenase family protein, partial [Saprospiraceae bacterium]|nr:aldehyde dehydrogenase family protein [Saprospiraceae bacterium]
LVATTFLAGKEELEQAIEKGLSVRRELKHLPLYKRYKILMQISNTLQENKASLALLLSKESGKPMRYALGEIERASQSFLVAAEETKRITNEYLALDWTASGKGKEGLVKYFPIGLIAGIAPFNFPLNLAVHKIAPAIATGNPIILKPARATPLSVLELAKIIDKTDLPKGAVSILPMNRVSGNQLVTDSRFSKLSFTGSPQVGWLMKSKAGKKRITLELGGNAGVLISKKADLERAVKKCLIGSFAYSGQVCIHVQRIYVESTVFDAFTKMMIQGTKQLKQGNPEDMDTDISSMIDENNAKRVASWVADAVADGAQILCGGKRQGTYFEPTILTHTKPEMNVCRLEIFGPVVTIEKVANFEEGIKAINASDYGLQAGVFTDSIQEINQSFDELEVGGVIHNDVPTFRVDHMPYGGIKNSGFGREGIKYAMRDMLEAKLLVKDS